MSVVNDRQGEQPAEIERLLEMGGEDERREGDPVTVLGDRFGRGNAAHRPTAADGPLELIPLL